VILATSLAVRSPQCRVMTRSAHVTSLS